MTDESLSRSLYLRALRRDLRAAMAAAEQAAARQDFRTQARMLRAALKLSTRIAEANGVDVKGRRRKPETQNEAERIARDVIETVANRSREE